MSKATLPALLATTFLALSTPPTLADQEAAQVYTRVTAFEIAEILQGAGYRAEMTTDSQGDPLIQSTTEGSTFAIYFYDCSDTAVRSCKSIQFAIGFDMAQGTTTAHVNDWNRRNRFAKVYLDDENDPWLEFDVNIEGGVTQANLRVILDLWAHLVADFKNHIDW